LVLQWELSHAKDLAAQYRSQMDVTFTCFHSATAQARQLRDRLHELEDKIWQSAARDSDDDSNEETVNAEEVIICDIIDLLATRMLDFFHIRPSLKYRERRVLTMPIPMTSAMPLMSSSSKC
jgi:hypothetical protein